MTKDDEFDLLCKSFEDGAGSEVVTAIGDNKDTSEIMDEIDSFLEDENESDVDNKDFQPKSSIVSASDNNISLKTSSPISSITPLPCPIAPTSSLEIESSPPPPAPCPPPSPPDPLAKHWSEIAPSLANLPEDQARPVEQVAVTSDGLDLSLLDKEEWEDDWEMREFTLSDMLNELKEHLLDESDDEDDSDDTNIDVKSDQVEAVPNEKITVACSKDAKKEFENLQSRTRVTEDRYYQQLEDVWRMYEGQVGVGKVPSRQMMVRPRIFKNNGRIVGYETLQEYVDNNHPLWGPHRELFGQVLFKERTQGDLVRFIQSNWGDQQVNTARNLTVFSRGGRAGRNGLKEEKVVRNVGKVGKEVVDGKMSIKATLVDMYANSANVDGVKQTEEARWKLFEAQLKTKLQEAEGGVVEDDVECDLCGEVCLCVVGGKRKRGGGRAIKMTKQQYADIVLANARKQNWNDDRIAEVIFGVEEAYELQSCYNNPPYFTKEQVCELNSVEEVHDMMMNMYDSPYKKDNDEQADTGTWSKQLLEDY